MSMTSVFALFIGMFIIYNSFSIAVTQRRGEIGILRALGATQGQVRRLFLGESAMAGLFGSVAGLGLGNLLAQVMTGYVSTLFEGVYGMAERADEVSADPQRDGARARHGPGHQPRGRLHPGGQRVARRSDPGAPEGQVPGPLRRREPDPAAGCCGIRAGGGGLVHRSAAAL